jgi:putative chitinase
MDFLTEDKLRACFPQNKNINHLYEVFMEVLPEWEIDTPERVAAFLAQCGHESAGFSVLKENLNYGAKGLRGTFAKYFRSDDEAAHYERKPEMIANKVYANRMNNGPEESGDGWKFRGRGAIQLTGKANYTKFGESVGMSAEEAVEYCESLDGAIESACWFWQTNKLNDPADKLDMLVCTKRINGGTIGLQERTNHFNHFLEILTS